MAHRRTALAGLLLLAGVVLVASGLYRVWLPTVGSPNYWEHHTGGLLPLVVQSGLGGGLVVAGITLWVDGVGRWRRSVPARLAGLAGSFGGVLGYGPVERTAVDLAGAGRAGFFGLDTVTLALLAIAALGLVARYPSLDRWGRAFGGVAVGGFLALAGASLLGWATLSIEPRTGALSYPPLGVELVGTLAVAAGSAGLGIALRRHQDTPQWLGTWLLAVGLLAVPVGVAAFFQRRLADGLVGLAWVAVAAHLAGASDYSSSSYG